MSNKFDATGTAPGLQTSQKPEPKKVSLKCRYAGCKGTQAVEVSLGQPSDTGAPSQRVYQCTTCQGTWGLPVGGFFPY